MQLIRGQRSHASTESEASFLGRLARYVKPTRDSAAGLAHAIHPYPAKYIPALPRDVILQHTNERHTVLDPFCGSGTTLLESWIRGRRSIGIDSNPVAALIARAKTTRLDDKEMAELSGVQALLETFTSSPDVPESPLPDFPRRDHWFQANMLRELSWLRGVARQSGSSGTRTVLNCVLSSIIVLCSNQESDTRYAAIDKRLTDGYAIRQFSRRLKQAIAAANEIRSNPKTSRNSPQIICSDLRTIDELMLPTHSIDLIVTSPPYPNSYDYYLYHKLRMYWLGFDVNVAKQNEIGSRHEHSSRRAPIATFEQKMAPCMHHIARVLKPSKLAYFFVGDAIIDGNFIDMAAVMQKLGVSSGLGYVGGTDYSLDDVSRSFKEKRSSINRNKYEKRQHILIFEGRAPKSQILSASRATVSPRPTWELKPLNGTLRNGDRIAIQDTTAERHIHSLGRYPSKFIPDIPRWAINEFTTRGMRVLDPFVGCGTTAVEAVLAARNPIGIDISPYACLLTRAKTTHVSETTLRRHAHTILGWLKQPRLFSKARRLKFEYDAFWFSLPHLEEFAALRSFVEEEIPPSTRDFFLAVLSTTIRRFSYQDESQIKVKRDPKKVLHGTASPIELLLQRLPVEVERLVKFNELMPLPCPTLVCLGSAEEAIGINVMPGSVDLVVTSPPYINAMNYPMTHRYENLLLGLVPENNLIQHQQEYIGTERVYSKSFRELRQFPSSSKMSRSLNDILRRIYDAEPKRSYIAYSFFTKMERVTRELAAAVRSGGILVLVVGNNMIRGVPVPTFESLVSMAESSGFALRKQFTYEIVRNAFKIHRHETGKTIAADNVAVFERLK